MTCTLIHPPSCVLRRAPTLTLARLASLALLCMAAVLPARSESLASSASSAGSASVGSVSDSLRGSSNSSTRHTRQVAEGEYRIVEITALAQPAGTLRVTLQALAPSAGEQGGLTLDLPKQALAQRGLTPRDIISVRHRPYGLEFAHASPREAFFLVLDDDWRRDLDARVVAL